MVDALEQPIQMLSTHEGVIVYSIGLNGIDEQGINEWSDSSVTGDEDDFSFELLNAELRDIYPIPATNEENQSPKN